MSILFFLFLIIVFVIVAPLLRVLLRIYLQTRRYRKAFDAFTGGRQPQADGYTERETSRGGWTYPLRRKKKVYSRDEGEYVDFKEVKVTASATESSSSGSRSYTREQQVTDAEWEEIS